MSFNIIYPTNQRLVDIYLISQRMEVIKSEISTRIQTSD